MKMYLIVQFIWVLQNQYKVLILVSVLQRELHTHSQSSISPAKGEMSRGEISAMRIIVLYGVGGVSTQNLE